MSELGDDELALIISWVIDQNDRKSFSQVCKQWLNVESQTRLSIRVFEPELLHKFLPRFPNLLTFECWKRITNNHLEIIATTCPKLEFLNLKQQSVESQNLVGFDDISDFDDVGVLAIANGCCKLCKVLFRRRMRVGNVGVISLVKCAQSLGVLDLGRCSLINDSSLEAIGCMNSIRALNLEGCSLITDKGLAFLATGSSSRTLKRLVLAECDRLTDFGVSLLQGMCCLEELNLAECGPKVTDNGGMAVASIASLKRLNLSWLINVSDITLVAISENCRNLIALDLTGCEMITGAGIRAFGYHECLESLVLASCDDICGDDVDMVLKCKSLRSIVLDKGLKMWISMRMQENISRFCKLHWR
ncbi:MITOCHONDRIAL ATP SYNTHASE COUPLING FACTOR B [Salix koriyanagi]|uniref:MITOCHONDRIAL ATP SYNTHASE COUPLING FACTOR B n=1 Tax=Salix koriyanagi TaxID=2511006 RepID=A0A9Q0ZSS1_9ROSI|nr:MITOCHONDRIAL ATP SYNTHASE COUPLING FACTOR B [Salix koriyanagi]KAJ6745621.1 MITOCHONDRIAL ATP SYNTHASE COUPLING FACTOR B [Salix koriyanagi]